MQMGQKYLYSRFAADLGVVSMPSSYAARRSSAIAGTSTRARDAHSVASGIASLPLPTSAVAAATTGGGTAGRRRPLSRFVVASPVSSRG